ncbi:cytosine permease [Agreia pratensis]|uniref:Nucleobase:cation symporter-1, NCS1 family n=1 Tax=Agreia pratensis TaxID=150121 RepID=A0A1X7I9R2_9MICO|nr:cytosine permease [Agreia pratensis]MBF4633413.1 cytosine permease [Agreia pratensis]SMG11138.1 nucleobase:cation symporter-1, NCS1 family [Agreia pratensis]
MTLTAAPKTQLVEPGGIEPIPADRRHGSPWQLFATWTSPNLEFATIFVGVIAVLYFGLSFWQAVAALLLGNFLGSLSQGFLSTWGPREGLAQMLLGRTAFGFWGNIVPAGLNTAMAGLGWFAVNSISGAFALATLTGWNPVLTLAIVVVVEVTVAFVGHDIVQLFERYAMFVLGAIFLIAGIFILSNADTATPAAGDGSGGLGGFAGFMLAAGAAFGYTAGWNPYAADYTRYLRADTDRRKIAIASGLGNFVSTSFLMIVGAASATIVHSGLADDASPTDSFTAGMPGWISSITLLAIAVGAVSANALNIYSGSMSFLAIGIKIPFERRRAIVALGFGVLGFVIALLAMSDAGASYENFLLVISYWIAPWLGIVLADRWLRRGTAVLALVVDEKNKYRNPAGIIAFVIAAVVSIGLFSNQAVYVGLIVRSTPEIGDLTALVGFALAAVLYVVVFRLVRPALGAPLSTDTTLPAARVEADA